MSGRSPTATRLFWTIVIGSGAGFWYGLPAFAALACETPARDIFIAACGILRD